MTLLPCFLLGHKPLPNATYCKWCYLYLEGADAQLDAEATADMTPEETVLIDPDSLEFRVKQEHEEMMRKLNNPRSVFDEDDDEA